MEQDKITAEIVKAEAKDRLVLEYLDLCLECTEPLTSFRRRHEILDRLEDIRGQLGMEPIGKA